MKLVIALNFMVLALIMMGLFLIVQANYGRLTQSSKYWSVALLCDATGLALLGGLFLVIPDFDHSNWLGTLANSLLFSAVLYQSLSIRALRADIAPQRNTQALAAIMLFAAFWELTKSFTGVSFRILFFCRAGTHGFVLAALRNPASQRVLQPDQDHSLFDRR